jgi:hypothetical protein
VYGYFDAVDKLLTSKIAEAQCAVVASEGQMVDDIVSRFPWVSEKGPMQDLHNYITAKEAAFKPIMSPTAIKAVLDDVSLKASIVSCKNFAIATARADANKVVRSCPWGWCSRSKSPAKRART